MTDPVAQLTDTLKLLRIDVSDIHKRQLTEDRLKHLQASLEDTAKAVREVGQNAAQGAFEGTKRVVYDVDRVSKELDATIRTATDSLSDARREASHSVLARRRNITAFCLFSALTGLLLGALLSLVVLDYHLAREFKQSVQGYGGNWTCERAGGFITDQTNGKFCAVEIKP
jgi:hypothetical protein